MWQPCILHLNLSKKVQRQMRAKKRARWARLFGAQFAVVTLFRKVLDLRPPPSLLSRGLPITKSMDMFRHSGACANCSSYLSRWKTRFAEARTCEVKRHFHISYKAPYLPPKILHSLCFSCLLGITAVPREIENNAYAEFWGQRRCIMGNVEVAYTVIAFTALNIISSTIYVFLRS